MSAEFIGVLLVDDQPLARRGFALMLRKTPDIQVIAEAGDGRAAVDLLDAAHESHAGIPDVVLMDVRMPIMDGIESTRVIATRHPSVKILVLTTYDEDDHAFSALAAGASGFLLKDVRTSELAAAVRAVAGRDAVFTPRITRQVIDRGVPRALPDDQRAQVTSMVATLTPRELQVARLIADGHSNMEIAERLVLDPASVRRNLSRILGKMGSRDRVQIAVTWHKAGL